MLTNDVISFEQLGPVQLPINEISTSLGMHIYTREDQEV